MEWLPSKPKTEGVKLFTGQDDGGFYAYDERTFCGCGECHCDGGTIGRGATEAEAVQDLMEKLA